MDQTLLLKILKGIATDQEKEDFFTQCESHLSEKQEYIRLKKLWGLSAEEKFPDKHQSFEKFWRKTHPVKHRNIREILPPVVKYAAAIIFIFLIGRFAYTFDRDEKPMVQTFASQIGSVSFISLDDGSKVWLNSGSEIRFVHSSGKLLIARLNGEAYFDIVHNDKREFIVETGKLRIHDLGTKFNIKAYQQEDRISATLAEGDIAIRNQSGELIGKIKPEEQFVYNKANHKYLIRKIDPQLAAGWKDGKFVFIDMSLAEICSELEKWYNISIVIENNKTANEKYSCILNRTTTIQEMMEILKLTAKINYKIKTYEKKKNEIYITK